MIELKKINMVYEDGFQALKDIDLIFEEGQINVLIGPSGCGKTTTMKLLNRLTDYTDGELFVDGTLIKDINPIDLRRQMGYVIQSIGLFPHMTIFDNVAAIPKLLKWDKEKINQKVDELLNMVGLDPEVYKKRYPNELSGGQQQRIGVIRALAAEPSTILMDEPFSALDPIRREQLQDELVNLQKDINKTIVFVTHDMDEALKIADQIILMKDGEIVQKGSPTEILANPANAFVEEFIGADRLEQAKGLPPMTAFIDHDYPVANLDMSVDEALALMVEKEKDQLPVLTKKGKFVGIVSFYQAFESKGEPLSAIINRTIDGYDEESDVEEVVGEYDLFAPIVSKDKKYIGMLNQDKLLKVLHEKIGPKSGVR